MRLLKLIVRLREVFSHNYQYKSKLWAIFWVFFFFFLRINLIICHPELLWMMELLHSVQWAAETHKHEYLCGQDLASNSESATALSKFIWRYKIGFWGSFEKNWCFPLKLPCKFFYFHACLECQCFINWKSGIYLGSDLNWYFAAIRKCGF